MTFQDLPAKEQVRLVMAYLRRGETHLPSRHRLANSRELIDWMLSVGCKKIMKLITEIENETA